MADIHREIRIFSALNTLEEIIVFAFGICIEMDLLGADHRVQDLF